MTQISPFAFLVNAAAIREAARRAELLDLPRHRSPKYDLARRARLAEVKSAEDLELDSILDEMENGMEADVDLLLSRLESSDDLPPAEEEAGQQAVDVAAVCAALAPSCNGAEPVIGGGAEFPLAAVMVAPPEAASAVAS